MCGLAGWFGSAPPGGESLLKRMVAAIRHRGPDGCGHHLHPMAALGHVRLAIIDPQSGAQPLWDASGKAVIAYNGEVYNFPGLRETLRRDGVFFKTRTDTETVLALYLREGVAGLARLSGMFAFAVWEPEAQRGILVRDRQGIKPLFYRQDGQRLWFASEAKALLPGFTTTPGLDPGALHLLMNFRYIPGEQTLFQGIRQLPPGGVLVWERGAVRRERLAPFAPSAAADPDDARLRREVADAVDRHLLADVPVGGYLSAGLDSATIATVVRRLDASRPFPTFTIDAGDDPTEADGASETARILGFDNLRGPLPDQLEAWLPRLIWHLETPKVNALQSAAVARLAAGGVKVALSGLGGDELFFGYDLHRHLWWQERLRHGPTGGLTRKIGWLTDHLLPLDARPVWEEYGRGARMVAALGSPRAYGILRNVWDTPAMRRRLYGPRMLDQGAALPDAFQWLEAQWPHDQPDFVRQGQCFENRNKLVNDFLWNEDRMSMAFGLEVRTPFLDESLHALVGNISWRDLMPGGRPKGRMRRLVAPWLAPEICRRPKSGFQVSARDFFGSHLRPLAETWLSGQRLRRDGLFNPEFVRTLLRIKPDKRLRWHYFILYLMAGTAAWLDLFEGGGEPPPWR